MLTGCSDRRGDASDGLHCRRLSDATAPFCIRTKREGRGKSEMNTVSSEVNREETGGEMWDLNAPRGNSYTSEPPALK